MRRLSYENEPYSKPYKNAKLLLTFCTKKILLGIIDRAKFLKVNPEVSSEI